jgi:hypothetical protein
MVLKIKGNQMNSLQEMLQQLNESLDQLIQVAKKLKETSLQVVSEEELEPLQKEQEEVLHRIEKIDQLLQQYYAGEISKEIHQQIHEKLQIFQELNQEYVRHLAASHGIIQFELRHLPSESDESIERLLARRSNPMLFMTDHSETIHPEENQES